MIKVCDAIMGSGKSSAAIRYMNEHALDKRFIYITPFIDETTRIQNACPHLNFWKPSSKLPEHEFRKMTHFKSLISGGKNIAITHTLFSMCDSEAIQMIADAGYSAIIDEAIEVFNPLDIHPSDIRILIDSGWLVRDGDDGNIHKAFRYYEQAAEKKYQGGRFHDLFLAAKSNRLIEIDDEVRGKQTTSKLWTWSVHKELFESLNEIFVLTYMFQHSSLRCFFELYGMPYDYFGVEQRTPGEYVFAEKTVNPTWVLGLKERIHILANKKLNSIGNNKHSLSASWFKRESKLEGSEKLERIKLNMANYYKHYAGGIPACQRLWSTYGTGVSALRNKGFYRNDIPFNSKAINCYGDCRALAYCVNIFQNPNMVRYYKENGIDYDDDGFALSTMLQWIWRSAIRNGEEIWIYIPSRRMRELLIGWLDEISNGGNQCD